MAALKQDITDAADQIARALRSSNYRANFSPESLWDIDLFFEDHSQNGAPKPSGLLSQQMGARLFALGGYVGETVRRHLGGEWQADDSDAQGEINIALKLPDGSIIWPVQRVMKRLKNGSVDGIAAYGSGLGLQVGAKPTPFSPYRSQVNGATSTAPISEPPRHADEYGANREHKITSSILLFLASALAYSLFALLIASFFDGRFRGRIPPAFFLLIDMALFWGGTRLWSGWRKVLCVIWFAFCPLAISNSFYFRHLQVHANELQSAFLAAMSKSSLVMAGLAVIVSVVMFLLQRAEINAESED